MYPDDVFAILMASNNNEDASKTLNLQANNSLFVPAEEVVRKEPPPSQEPPPSPMAISEDGSDTSDEEPDYRYCAQIVLRFGQQLKDPSKGFQFGTGPDVDVVLYKSKRKPRASAQHFTITADAEGRIFLHDTSSENGTSIQYDEHCAGDIRHNETWLLAYGPYSKQMWKEIRIHIGRISFLIVFPKHVKTTDSRYVENLNRFSGRCTWDFVSNQDSQMQDGGITNVYVPGEKLGSGSFGDVNLVVHARDGVLMAKKTFKQDPQMTRENWRNAILAEFRTQKQLEHRNIVPVYEWMEDGENPSMIMQYYPRGNLQGYRREAEMSVEKCLTLLLGLLNASNYLHTKNIIHRDIKPPNVLVDFSSGRFDVVLADFGIAKFSPKDSFHSVSGSHPYMAPEIFEAARPSYTKKTDMWAIGCAVIESYLPRMPEQPIALLPKRMQKSPTFVKWAEKWGTYLLKALHDNPRVNRACEGDEFFQVVAPLLRKDPATRFSAQQALAQGQESGFFVQGDTPFTWALTDSIERQIQEESETLPSSTAACIEIGTIILHAAATARRPSSAPRWTSGSEISRGRSRIQKVRGNRQRERQRTQLDWAQWLQGTYSSQDNGPLYDTQSFS